MDTRVRPRISTSWSRQMRNNAKRVYAALAAFGGHERVEQQSVGALHRHQALGASKSLFRPSGSRAVGGFQCEGHLAKNRGLSGFVRFVLS